MLEELTTIDLGLSQNNTYKIHPSVVVNILNVYYRNVKKDFLMGILLGKTYPDYVSVSNMIFVAHSTKEDDSIEIQIDPALKILDYTASLFNESKVGWFCTKPQMDRKVAGVHRLMAKHLKSPTSAWAGPLCLLIDCSLTSGKIQMTGFTSQVNKMYKDLFVGFQPANVQIEMLPEDNPAVNSLLYDGLDPERTFNDPKDKENDFEDYVGSMIKKIEALRKLIAEADEEVLQKNPEIVRKIQGLLSLRMAANTPEEKAMAQRFKEHNELLKYHAKLIETQVLVSERLGQSIKLQK